ncbi:MAG: hypothetical protein Q8P67_03565, partial [archaeon]|nr:hypothetical protein [archaeon]
KREAAAIHWYNYFMTAEPNSLAGFPPFDGPEHHEFGGGSSSSTPIELPQVGELPAFLSDEEIREDEVEYDPEEIDAIAAVAPQASSILPPHPQVSQRDTLPIDSHRGEILNVIKKNRVCVLHAGIFLNIFLSILSSFIHCSKFIHILLSSLSLTSSPPLFFLLFRYGKWKINKIATILASRSR